MDTHEPVEPQTQLPPPWDRIFALSTRVFVWGLLFGCLYLLRPFLLLVFLTFVFAYILEHGVHGLQHRIANRPLRVVLVTTVFLATLISVGVFLAPSFRSQAEKLAENYPAYLERIDVEIDKVRDMKAFKNRIPEDLDAESILGELAGFLPESKKGRGDPAATPSPPPTATAEERSQRLAETFGVLKNVAGPILGIGSAFLLSLLFSFLIVLDLPKLSRAVRGLRDTKLRFIYDEVAQNIQEFGAMLGRALEAQLFIALCNTILTALGLYFLGLVDNLVFLSTIVFFCSFIPVAGVFISSTPIALEALIVEGPQLMLLAIVLILIIHFIEAYFLNPKIFGHHLHMNAVLVLIVLTIGGKLFGVWGLVLGLPVVNYFFGHAIRFAKKAEDDRPKVAA